MCIRDRFGGLRKGRYYGLVSVDALSKGLDIPEIMGDIIAEWEMRTHAEFGGPVRTLVFAPTVNYAANLVGSFQERGWSFGLVSYRDTYGERQEKLDGLRKGRYYGLVSVDALSKGLDIPEIMCLSTVRAYKKSLAAWIQTLGRGMRAAPGKKKCLLLDHSGNWMRHFERTMTFWNLSLIHI